MALDWADMRTMMIQARGIRRADHKFATTKPTTPFTHRLG